MASDTMPAKTAKRVWIVGAALLLAGMGLLGTILWAFGPPTQLFGASPRDPLVILAERIARLPVRPGTAIVAATAGEEGHWRFVNRSGEAFTAASAAEIARMPAILAPERDGTPRERVEILLTSESFRDPSRQLKDLPAEWRLLVDVDGRSLPLLRGAGEPASGHLVEAASRIALPAGDAGVLAEAAWQLARPFDAGTTRIIALESVGGPTPPPGAARRVGAAARSEIERIAPEGLVRALQVMRGGTAIIAGRLDGDALVYATPSGPEATLPLAVLRSAAASSDVRIIVLGTDSPRQPGHRNWLWLRTGVAGVSDGVLRGASLAELIARAGVGEGRFIARTTDSGTGRVELQLAPAASGLTLDIDGIVDKGRRLVGEALGEAGVRRAIVLAPSRSRHSSAGQWRLPILPVALQQAYLFALALGLLGTSVASRWWRRIWPPESRAEYGMTVGYLAARLVRTSAFVLMFAPLVAMASVPMVLTRAVGRLVADRSQTSGLREDANHGR